MLTLPGPARRWEPKRLRLSENSDHPRPRATDARSRKVEVNISVNELFILITIAGRPCPGLTNYCDTNRALPATMPAAELRAAPA
jgi:hypothetical protein